MVGSTPECSNSVLSHRAASFSFDVSAIFNYNPARAFPVETNTKYWSAGDGTKTVAVCEQHLVEFACAYGTDGEQQPAKRYRSKCLLLSSVTCQPTRLSSPAVRDGQIRQQPCLRDSLPSGTGKSKWKHSADTECEYCWTSTKHIPYQRSNTSCFAGSWSQDT